MRKLVGPVAEALSQLFVESPDRLCLVGVVLVRAEELEHGRTVELVLGELRLECQLLVRETKLVAVDRVAVAAVASFAPAHALHADEHVDEQRGDQHQDEAVGVACPEQREPAQPKHQSEVREDVAHSGL